MGVVLRRTSLAALPLLLVFLFLAQLFRVTADEQTTITGEPAYLLAGHEALFSGDRYIGGLPPWLDGVHQFGGTWSSNTWRVASVCTNEAWIVADFASMGRPAFLGVEISLRDEPDASLLLELIDANDRVLTDVGGGNLLHGTPSDTVVRATVTIAAMTNAAALRLRRDRGAVTVRHVVLTPAAGGVDDAVAGGTLTVAEGSSNTVVVAEGTASTPDGASMATEPGADGTGVHDASGSRSNRSVLGRSPSHIVHVDAIRGHDGNSGCRATSAANDGPKATIRGGLNAAGARDLVLVHGGTYDERLSLAGRDRRVRIDGRVRLGAGQTGSRQSAPPAGMMTNRVVTANQGGIELP